ncbi:uncharacterized protein DUF5077 [Dyadobacter jejuensis]|uniref:Uncharacterized protein DUF5077 n=1 Tax=Dyadobacter jejuensis TaxID=1082580 RepID=A0A316ARL2_9BACT|nr:DUF3472 domain-containing protein [Dyadobacter jejuensis]PWJ60051.1 uncharacterized protein DUF5077 [Dyadobacter jejuensis]
MNFKYLYCLLLLIFCSCTQASEEGTRPTDNAQNGRVVVPLGGNAYIGGAVSAKLTPQGLVGWSSPEETIDTYIRFSKTGNAKLSLRATLSGDMQVKVSLGGDSRVVDMSKNMDGLYELGEWAIADTGYVKIGLQGMRKTGSSYGEVQEWVLEGDAVDADTKFVANNTDNYFYWGRRGPSVHLNYPLPAELEPVEWFYNEVTVPQGQDVIGSYFMANGFAQGYFGMQVNSEQERRILFSVWSPFQTDDPASIPVDKRIVLLSKGADVYAGEFGNEGSGGQSYLRYNWKAGNTYRFLLRGVPGQDSTTTFTAYFYAPEVGEWALIASFKRPDTKSHLTRLHSFLENFVPDMGVVERRVNFGNQWVRSTTGEWRELTTAGFTADATARKAFRMDYAGGQDAQYFYLKNCGFFSDYTPINSSFERKGGGTQPAPDFEKLKKLYEDALIRP